MRATWTLAPLVATAVLLAGCGGASPAAQDKKESALVPPLYYMEGGVVSRPLSNGGSVPLGGNRVVQLYISPYPPTPDSKLDLFIYESGTGRPITNAKVTVRCEMLYMDHGVSNVDAIGNGNGHYLALLKLGMVGEWLANIDVMSGGEQSNIRLGLTLTP